MASVPEQLHILDQEWDKDDPNLPILQISVDIYYILYMFNVIFFFLIILIKNYNKLTLNDAICALTVALANLADFALNFIGVNPFLASWSNDCNTKIVQQKITLKS